MKRERLFRIIIILSGVMLSPAVLYAQVTRADYERAAGLRDKLQGLVINAPERANWIGQTSRFWYRKSVKGGAEFALVDAATGAKGPAFDHEKMATSLSAAANPAELRGDMLAEVVLAHVEGCGRPSRG